VPRFRLEAVEQGMALRNARTLLGVPRLLWVCLGSRSSPIGLISLTANCAGARSAGNPHATCDVAGAGNGATASPTRARRGKPRIQAKDEPTGYRASAVVLVKFCKFEWDRLTFDAGMGSRARAAWERLALVSPVETITPHLPVFAMLPFFVRSAVPC
jgi:hypothetical protein